MGFSWFGTAKLGRDFTAAVSGGGPVDKATLTFAAGQQTLVVVVTPIDDTLVEPIETVIVTLKAGTTYTLGSASSATGSIADNDGKTAAATTLTATTLSSGTTGTTSSATTVAPVTTSATTGDATPVTGLRTSPASGARALPQVTADSGSTQEGGADRVPRAASVAAGSAAASGALWLASPAVLPLPTAVVPTVRRSRA